MVTSSKEFKLKVFIDKKTYAIIHLEYENTIPEDLGKKSGLERKFESLKRVVDFKFYEGKFFLIYILQNLAPCACMDNSLRGMIKTSGIFPEIIFACYDQFSNKNNTFIDFM